MHGYMNEPQECDGRAYIKEMWVMCPYCGRRQFKIDRDTKIKNLAFKCKNTKCKHDMIINTE